MIRTALGDSGDNPRFVQTIPKRGFKFIAPVAPDFAMDATPIAPILPMPPPGGGVDGLETEVVEEFERAVREHILNRPAN